MLAIVNDMLPNVLLLFGFHADPYVIQMYCMWIKQKPYQILIHELTTDNTNQVSTVTVGARDLPIVIFFLFIIYN